MTTTGDPRNFPPSPGKPDAYEKLPHGQVRITHGFPNRGDQSLAVFVDGKPVCHLPVTKVGFEQSYGDGFGYITLKMLAGDCQIIASRPEHKP